MGSKYTTNTISGYNADPPPDDGSKVAANQGKWATIKTKLGDPTKVLAEAIDTALVSHFDVGPDAKTGNYSIAAGDYGKTITTTGERTVTLLDAATAGAGFYVIVKPTDTAAVTVDLATAADKLDGTANGTHTLANRAARTYMVTAAADEWMTIAQSPDVTQVQLMSGRVAGMMASNGTDASHDIDLTAGVCADTTGTYLISIPATTIAIDTVGLNGISTGTSAADTLYYIWAVFNPSTGGVGYVFDTASVWASVTKTNISGYTVGQVVWAVMTDSTTPGNIRGFVQAGDVCDFDTPIQDVTNTAAGSGENTIALSVPANSEWRGTLRADQDDLTAALTVWIYRAGSTARTSVNFATGHLNMQSDPVNHLAAQARCMVNASSQVTYKVTEPNPSSSVRIATDGFRMLSRGNGT